MKKIICTILGIILFAVTSRGTTTPREIPTDFPTTGVVNILAIRVEFQPDTTSLTTGNGKMNLETVDPPHDKQYFLNKLNDLSHYFDVVSYGNLNLIHTTYPTADSCYTLSHKMSYYSQSNEDENISWEQRINELLKEAINRADSDIDFSINPDRTAIMIIHAGASSSSDEYGDSSHDLPSAFLPPSDLQEYLGEFIETDDGVLIDRGMIVPETTSQDGIKRGLLGTWAQIFGYQLGLPSLYDTQKGETRIGGWGLMDIGSSNYRGFSPAHPCAWSKIRLDWIDPQVINFANSLQCTLKAVETYPEVIKIPITTNEYFLLENREQDANGDEIPNVDEYDFSLPGSGLLIWHIDENVIEQNLQTNTINIDPDRKGVDLEEADGVQDFDEFVQGNYYFYGGFYRDPFFEGNNSVFNENSMPNSNSNDGALSHISISQISEFAPEMTFTIDIDYSQDGWKCQLDDTQTISGNSLNYADFNDDGNVELYFVHFDSTTSTYSLSRLQKEGQITDLFTSQYKIYPPAICDSFLVACDFSGDIFYYYSNGETEINHKSDQFLASPAIINNPSFDDPIRVVFIGSHNLYLDDLSVPISGETKAPLVYKTSGEIVTLSKTAKKVFYKRYDRELNVLNESTFSFEQPIAHLSPPTGSDMYDIAFSVDNQLYIIDLEGEIRHGYPITHEENISTPIFAQCDEDIQNSQEVFVIGESGETVYSWQSKNGVTTEEFPKDYTTTTNGSGNFIKSNCVSLWKDNVFGLTAGNRIFAWDYEHERNQFPIPFDTQSEVTSPMLVDLDSDGDIEFIAVSDKNQLNILDFPFPLQESYDGRSLIEWGMYRSDPQRTGVSHATSITNTANVLPEPNYVIGGTFYAYPNPAKGSNVHIRYKLRDFPPENPTIKIFDLSGDLIEEFIGDSSGSYNEVIWNIENISSGVYLCRIEVMDQVNFTKIAIVQ